MERRLAGFNLHSLNTANLHLRILSALIMMPVALGAVYLGGVYYILFVTLIMLLGLREWLRLVDPNAKSFVIGTAFFALVVILALGALLSVAFGAMIGTILVLILFMVAARDHEERAGWIALGIPYMAGSGLALIYLRTTEGTGMALVFYLLAVVWGTDIGAYIAGRLIGGPKLIPLISPNKTWAGLLGGMALAAIFGYVVSLGFHVQQPGTAVGLALLLAVVSQLGDLFESYFKRRSGVKESGGLIPGHGGVLDRIDGLVFAAIFLMLFQIALGAHMEWL